MDLADVVGCLGRDNRGRPQPGAFVVVGQGLIPPELVEPGKGQRLTVLPVDVVGLLALFSVLRDGLPLEVADRADRPLADLVDGGQVTVERVAAGDRVVRRAAIASRLGVDVASLKAYYASLPVKAAASPKEKGPAVSCRASERVKLLVA